MSAMARAVLKNRDSEMGSRIRRHSTSPTCQAEAVKVARTPRAADVVGYSRLMGRDELGTPATLKVGCDLC